VAESLIKCSDEGLVWYPPRDYQSTITDHEQLQLQLSHASQQKGDMGCEEVARPVVSLS
jgi:hypothetical protein